MAYSSDRKSALRDRLVERVKRLNEQKYTRGSSLLVYPARMPPDIFWAKTGALLASLIVLAGILGACAVGEPLEQSDQDEGGKRPGILSGSSGAFVIYGDQDF